MAPRKTKVKNFISFLSTKLFIAKQIKPTATACLMPDIGRFKINIGNARTKKDNGLISLLARELRPKKNRNEVAIFKDLNDKSNS